MIRQKYRQTFVWLLVGLTAFSVHSSIFNTDSFSSGSSYSSMHRLEGRETIRTGQQSITGLTQTFTFTLTSTPRSNSECLVHQGKLQHSEDANTGCMNKNAVYHFKQQNKSIFQVDSRLNSTHVFLCIMQMTLSRCRISFKHLSY